MKKVRLSEIKEIFEKLLDKRISREDASSWAIDLQNAEDSNLLEYEPSDKEELVWDAILFLQVVDLKDSPDTYLHNKDDIQNFHEKLKC